MLRFFNTLIICIFLSSFAVSTDAQIEGNYQAAQSLAKCLKQAGAKMYGSPKCGHCKGLIKQFQGGFESQGIPFMNCKGSAKMECRQLKVGAYPMWIVNGKKITRPHSIDELAVASGCMAQIQSQHGDTMIAAQPQSSTFGTTEDLAKCLTAKDVKFFGSPDCGHCKHNKEWFGGNFAYVKFHNCIGSKSLKAKCRELNTYPFPTWLQESTGKRLTRPHSIEQIANHFGCTIDQQSAPAFAQAPVSPVVPSQPQIAPQQDYFYEFEQQDNKLIQEKVAEDMFVELPIGSPYEPLPQAAPAAPVSEIIEYSPPAQQRSMPQSAPPAPAQEQQSSSQQKIVSDDQKLSVGECLMSKNAKLLVDMNQRLSQEQIKELGTASNMVNIIDCSKGQNAECSNVYFFPVWIVDQQKISPGFYEIDSIARITNCE